MTEDTQPTPLDDALFLWVWRSNVEELPRVIREPLMPLRGAAVTHGKVWADGRARLIVHPDRDDLPAEIELELAALDRPRPDPQDHRGASSRDHGRPATDPMEES